jgi:diguanylate cyclase (GGDEF)-like protein
VTGDVVSRARLSWVSLVRRREFGTLFVAHLLSLLGDRVATVAISVLVYHRSGSVLLTAATYATSLLPWLLGAPLLAAWSDRWPRRRVLLVCDAVRAGLVLLLTVHGLPMPLLLVLLTAVAWIGPPFEAARAATLPVVLPDEQEYLAGSAITMLSNQVSQVLGFAVGGALLTVVTTSQALFLDAGTFAASGLLIAVGLRPRPAVAPQGQRQPLHSAVREGARLVFADPLLRPLLLFAWLVAAFTVVPEGLAVARAADQHAPTYGSGLLLAAVPAGAACGAAALGRLSKSAREARRRPLGLLAMAALLASALAPTWEITGACWLLVGLGASVQLPTSAMFMLGVPDTFRARAFGLAQSGLMAGQGLALLVGGALAGQLGFPAVLSGAGAVGLVSVLLLETTFPRTARPARLTPGRAVDTWIGVVTTGAVLAVAGVLWWGPHRSSPLDIEPWMVAVGFAATGSYVASLRIGRQAHVFSLDDIPRLVGLVFLTPAGLIAARLGGALFALVLVRRQRGRKLLFNLASFALEVTVALAVFHALDPGKGIGPAVWPAALVATIAADLVSAWTVAIVIGLAEQDLRLGTALRPDRMTLATAVGAATIGMIAATTLWYAPNSALLLLVLVVLGMAGLRGFARLTEEGVEQRQLQAALRELGNLEPSPESWRAALEGVRNLLGVERVECWLTSMGPEDPFSGWQLAETPDCPVPADVVTRDRLRDELLHGPTDTVEDPPRPHRQLPGNPQSRQRGVARLAVLIPAAGETPLGVLVFTAPLGDDRPFTQAHVEMARTFADPLGQSVLRVRHAHQVLLSARQDRLTGMLNLNAFRTTLVPLLQDEPRALFLVNLDRLRAVNDVFGRDVGDQMIAAAGARLTDTVPGAVLGRISGHHFACVLPVADTRAALHLGRQIRSALELPLAMGELEVELGVHVGISLYPTHGDDPDLLLRRAETAGDAAKEDPFGVAVFVDDLEQDSSRPLRLVTDLRAALRTTGQLSLHFQPKVDLQTGRVLGCEALVRWQHPTLGDIGPDEFITLAENAGLIGELMRLTLDLGLQQAAAWHRAGLPATVAVNLSVRNLLDPDLVNQVADLLESHDVPPHLLTLEITETSVMAQPLRSMLMLDALSELGITLSIDDFGTGYSNLVYLRQLPVQEVKLDRSFLSPLRDEQPLGQGGVRAYEFLRHAIALVHSLGLHVVVEGVEDGSSLRALHELGADSAQGYFLCRPQAGDVITAWLASHTPLTIGEVSGL